MTRTFLQGASYKKIFVVAAALFLIFAPVGISIKNTSQNTTNNPTHGIAIAQGTMNSSIFLSPYPAFHLSFNPNLAEATSNIGNTGTGAGTYNAQQTPDFFSCVSSPATCGVFYVSLVVNGAMGLLLTGAAYLVKLGLQFNDNIFDAPAVQIGFSVSLAIANMGFVLGIIIIAIATIIRSQTYGIKQLLWKLVMMAILVNFGLVITAPIVGFADSISTYFVNATSPSAATGGYGAYVSTMMNAFNPQTPALAQAANGNSTVSQALMSFACQHYMIGGFVAVLPSGGWVNPWSIKAICEHKGISTSNPADDFWQSTMSLLFDVAFSAIAAFSFLCLAILLIVRYLMLGGLLIVLPLAWLTYIFPKFDNSYSKWWNTFIKWVFFPPLALFFIYLAFSTAAFTSGGNNNTATATSYSAAAVIGGGSNTTVEGSLSTQAGVNGDIVVQAGDEILLVGLMIMGLMFALSLSGKAGSTVVNGATAVTKATAGYVGKKTGRGAARLYQKAGGDSLNAAMQRNRALAPIGRRFANLTESATKNQVDARHKALGLGGMDDDRLKDVTQGLTGKTDQIAAVQEWQKRGKLDKIEKIGGVGFAEWLSKNQGTLKDFRQGKLSGDIDTAMGSNDKIRSIAGVIGGARASINEATIKKITESATVVDKDNVMGSGAGANVLAKDLAKAGRDETKLEAQQAIIDNPLSKKPDIQKARAEIKKLQDAAGNADQAIAEAINKKVDEVDVTDRENLLGRGAGKPAKAGEFRELMRAESEKFWEGKDKGDAAKIKSNAIFGNKAKFGLDKETLNEIGRSVAHGITTQVPSAMGSIAGKLDNSKQLETFTSVYKTSIEDARKAGKINDRRAKDLNDALKKVLAGKLAYMGVGGSEPAPAPAPKP